MLIITIETIDFSFPLSFLIVETCKLAPGLRAIDETGASPRRWEDEVDDATADTGKLAAPGLRGLLALESESVIRTSG